MEITEETLLAQRSIVSPEKPRRSEITVTPDFIFGSHRGFGKQALSRATEYGGDTGLTNLDNTLSGLEVGAGASDKTIFMPEGGGNTFEVDIVKTADGNIVTGHGNVVQKIFGEAQLPVSEAEFLDKNPEAFKFDELVDWLAHQDDQRLKLYVELKSQIPPNKVIEALVKADPDGIKKLAERFRAKKEASENAELVGVRQRLRDFIKELRGGR